MEKLTQEQINSLKKVEEDYKGKSNYKAESLWQLVNSIHSDPELREWVTIESSPLYPFIYKTNGDDSKILVLLLLSASDKDEKMLPPWGIITWDYITKKLLNKTKFQDADEFINIAINIEHLCTKDFIDNMERSIEAGEEIPQIPKELSNIYESKIKNITIDGEELKINFNTVTENIEELVEDYLLKAKEIIIKHKKDDLLKDWYRINAMKASLGFSIAVVGEFSRGKSSFINNLLGGEILPTGNLPTTAMLARIIYGDKPSLIWIHEDGSGEQLALEEENWDKISANINGNDPKGVIQIKYPCNWLKTSGIQIIDTPGAGDLNPKRLENVTEVIASCDAAVIAISASTALSLTEKTFIEDHILSRKFPCIALAITKIDQIQESERKKIVHYIKDKLNAWGYNIPIICIHQDPVLSDETLVNAVGINNIEKLFSGWASDKLHKKKRSNQILLQLYDVLNFIKDDLKNQKEFAKLAEKEKEKAIKAAELDIKRSETDWEEIRLKTKEKNFNCYGWIEASLNSKQNDIVQELQYKLKHVPNPKSWWNEDLPFEMKRVITGIARGIDEALQNRIAKDSMELNEAIKFKFDFDASIKSMTTNMNIDESVIESKENEMMDINKIRMLARIGFGATTIFGYLLFGPIGMAINIGGGILSEKIMGDNINNQRERLCEDLEDVVDNVIKNILQSITEKLDTIYNSMFNIIVKNQKDWVYNKYLALKNSVKTEDNTDNVDLAIEEVEKIMNNIIILVGED